MRSRRLLASAAALVSVWFLARARPSEDAGHPETRGHDVAGARSNGEPPMRNVDSKAPSIEESPVGPAGERASTADRDQELRGRVVGLAGEAIPDAMVHVTNDDGGVQARFDPRTKRADRLVAETRSDANGEFAVHLPCGRPYTLRVSSSGYATEVLPCRYAGEFVLVQSHRGCAIFGRVTRDADGAPIENVELLAIRLEVKGLPFMETRTDLSGSYRFDGLPPGSYCVEVWPTAEKPTGWDDILLKDGDALEKNAVVKTGSKIVGRVTDAISGEPIEGAEIGLGPRYQKLVRSDSMGGYALEGLPGSEGWEILARAEGYGMTERPIGPRTSDTITIDFALTPARQARGRIVAGDGFPLADVSVTAAGSAFEVDREKGDWISGRSGPDGAFDLRDLRADVRHTLVAFKEAYGKVVYDFPLIERESPIIDLGDIVLSPASAIAGVVVDDGGFPLPSVTITLRGWNEDRFRLSKSPNERISHTYAERRGGRTDDRGRFRFADVSAGEYRVSVDIEGMAERAETTVRVGSGASSEGVRLVLPAGLAIRGRVIDPRGRGLDSCWVQLRLETTDSGWLARARTGPDGAFRLAGLAGARYRLRATLPRNQELGEGEHHLSCGEVKGAAAGAEDVTIVLRHAQVIAGVVLESDGSGSDHAYVMAYDEHSDEISHAVSDSNGRFEVFVPEGATVTLKYFPQQRNDKASTGYSACVGAWSRETEVPAGATDVILRLPARQ